MKWMGNKIIYFHKIDDPNRISNVFTNFKSSFNIISIKDLEDFYYGKKKLKNSLHITFDDGDISFYENVFPVLKRTGIPVSLFVSPLIATEEKNFWFQEIQGYHGGTLKKIMVEKTHLDQKIVEQFSINSLMKSLKYEKISEILESYQKTTGTPPKRSQNMNVDQLRELNDSGLVNIGAHTLNHPILLNETDVNSRREIIRSITLLSELLESDVNSFAYPNGFKDLDYGRREMDVLSRSKVKLAFTTELRNFKQSDNPYAIPRYSLHLDNYRTFRIKLGMGRKWNFFKNIRYRTTAKNERIKFRKQLIRIQQE